jgi:hypothetical protein
MKKQFIRTTAILGLFLVLAISSANAQTAGRVEVNIPFDFSAGKVTLKAGDYSIKRTSGNALVIRSVDGKTNALISAPMEIGSRDYKAGQRLVFNQYGGRYFLSQVWLRIDNGLQLFTSGAEVKAARDYRLAKNQAKPQRVEIALHVR